MLCISQKRRMSSLPASAATRTAAPAVADASTTHFLTSAPPLGDRPGSVRLHGWCGGCVGGGLALAKPVDDVDDVDDAVDVPHQPDRDGNEVPVGPCRGVWRAGEGHDP